MDKFNLTERTSHGEKQTHKKDRTTHDHCHALSGVAADYHTYVGQVNREVREILARSKDFATGILEPDPTYLGETIPVSGDGNLTNDEEMESLLS